MIKTTRDGGKTNGKKEKRNRFKNLRIAANGKYRGQTGKELVRNLIKFANFNFINHSTPLWQRCIKSTF